MARGMLWTMVLPSSAPLSSLILRQAARSLA